MRMVDARAAASTAAPTSIGVRIFLICAVFLPLALFASAAYQDWRSILTDARGRVENERDLMVEHAFRVLKTQEIIALALLERAHGMTWNEIENSRELHNYTRRLQVAFPEILAVWLTDVSGIARAGSQSFPIPPVVASDRSYFQALRDGARRIISERFAARPNGEEAFAYAIRRETPDGRFDGVIGVAVRTSYFDEYYARTLGPGSVAGLVHQSGSLLAGYPTRDAQSESQHDFRRQVAQMSSGQDDPIYYGSASEIVYSSLRRVGDSPVFISSAIRGDYLATRWSQRVGLYGAYILPGLLVLTGLAALTWRRFSNLDDTVRARTAALASALDDKGHALADRETLLQEVHHRVKNNLQIVSSLVRMQARRSTDPEDTVRRIQAMALVHELIYASHGSFASLDLADYTRRLVAALADSAGGCVDIDLDLDPLTVDLDRAMPFALALSEVIANALRHAYPNGEGRIGVSLKAHGPRTGMLRVSDSGRGFDPSRVDPRGFGLTLIQRLGIQLDAEITYRQENGTTFEMTFPLVQAV